MKINKYIVFGTFLSLTVMISCIISSGSYPYAERYKLKISDSKLINIILEFKHDNPDYCVPNEIQLVDGKKDSNDYWYHIYFYYKNENKIVYTWVRQYDADYCEFTFVGINTGLILGNWKYINHDFSSDENKLEKEKFEHLILKQIKLKIQ
jgi:hypothetical protein